MPLALATVVANAAGGLLALALARPWGRIIPRSGLRAFPAAASVLPIVYGALNVLAAALVLSGALHPTGPVEGYTGRRCTGAGVWDLRFLVRGILLTLATIGP
jgi:hypothetical protein